MQAGKRPSPTFLSLGLALLAAPAVCAWVPGCDEALATRYCGDGVLDEDLGETCDRGAENSNEIPDACRLDCQPARCGDGVLDEGELCDPPESCERMCDDGDPCTLDVLGGSPGSCERACEHVSCLADGTAALACPRGSCVQVLSFESWEETQQDCTTRSFAQAQGAFRRGVWMAGAGANLLTNPGFERGTRHGWTETDNQDFLYVWEDDQEPHSGLQSARIAVLEDPADRQHRFGQTVNHIPPLDTMELVFFAKSALQSSDPAHGEKEMVATFSVVDASVHAWTAHRCYFDLESDWRELRCTSPPGFLANAERLIVHFSFFVQTEYWIDDVRLTKSSPSVIECARSGSLFDPRAGALDLFVKPAWTAGTGTGYDHRFILSANPGTTWDSPNHFYLHVYDQGSLALTAIDRAGTRHQLACPVDWQADTWHRVSAAWDLEDPAGARMRLFLEGEPCDELFLEGEAIRLDALAETFFLGSAWNGGAQFEGILDEVKLFSRPVDFAPYALPGCGNSIWDPGEDRDNCPSDANEYSLAAPADVQPLDTGDYVVGVFVFPGWHAPQTPWRTDFGGYDLWTPIMEFNEGPSLIEGGFHPRMPVQGYYDDSNPGAADWMIAWALEHGVGLFVFDWYAHAGKMSFQETLEQGFM
ncbi:MAG: hypothetical protein JXR96_15605, partial [Deltaproteobacteria bacterium]|nr:hypothetical protein [Deltaproteobacteria bacterium]